MRTIYLVSCVKTKRSSTCAAADLYGSQWFTAARNYVRHRANAWYILSAKYGLVKPDDVIAPYEHTLNTMGVAARHRWAERVLSSLNEVLQPGDNVVFLAGQRYREFLEDALRTRGITVNVPMRGLRQGEQVQWLLKNSKHDET